jgi:hypothetical protein
MPYRHHRAESGEDPTRQGGTMKDIVTQLRTNSECLAPSIMLAAADEIERLRAELKDAKARNTMYLSKIQEYEVREI